MNTSVVVTVRDEIRTIDALLDALDRQTRPADQIVIVDGGSTDGTTEVIDRWASGRKSVDVLSVAGANIAAGRNAAIRRAAGPVIAVTDAGCTPEPAWLAALAAPFDAPGVDVVMGFYRGAPTTRFERFLDCLNLPEAAEIDPATFMPSSRSVAFLKSRWEEVGGYPEWLAIGEDMYFNFELVGAGANRVFAPDALVHWRLRPTLRACFVQYFRYAAGDGRSGMYPRRHAVRFATYAGTTGLLVAAVRYPALLLIVPPTIAARMWPAYRRAARRLRGREVLLGLVALPALELLLDVAKMAGWIAGRAKREGRARGR